MVATNYDTKFFNASEEKFYDFFGPDENSPDVSKGLAVATDAAEYDSLCFITEV